MAVRPTSNAPIIPPANLYPIFCSLKQKRYNTSHPYYGVPRVSKRNPGSTLAHPRMHSLCKSTIRHPASSDAKAVPIWRSALSNEIAAWLMLCDEPTATAPSNLSTDSTQLILSFARKPRSANNNSAPENKAARVDSADQGGPVLVDRCKAPDQNPVTLPKLSSVSSTLVWVWTTASCRFAKRRVAVLGQTRRLIIIIIITITRTNMPQGTSCWSSGRNSPR